MAELARLMRAAHDADAAALAGCAARVEALRRRADALREPVGPPEGADFPMMAMSAQHDLWRASRRRALLSDLARARADQEEARARARISFGRARAAEALVEREGKGRR